VLNADLPTSDPWLLSGQTLGERQRQVVERRVRMEFLTFLATMLARYRNHVHFIDGAHPIFNTPAFLKEVQQQNQVCFMLLCVLHATMHWLHSR
jgi:hypothetical protein